MTQEGSEVVLAAYRGDALDNVADAFHSITQQTHRRRK